ncbi:MAG TPA: hypothetical protein VMW11_08260 [Candidatus Dormibacteraeota bacterium]|nr:hypothetical protein [Candidatus Dormibacteraeota bacterium]
MAAKDLLGLVGPEAMPSEAANALLEGVDSRSIRQLAGLNNAERDEVRVVFQTALRELDIESPTLREAAILVATEVAGRITDGSVSPYAGAKEIWDIARRLPLEHLPEFDTFVYGASEWEERPENRQNFADGIIAAAHDLVVANH